MEVDPIEILDNIILMAQRTKEALENNEMFADVYVRAVGENLENAYREMSFAALHGVKDDGH